MTLGLEAAVDAIWHIDKARGQQTGELLAGAIWARDRIVQREGLGPMDRVAATKEALEHTGGDLMIVGRLPFLGKLVARSSQAVKKMKSWSFDLAA